MNKLNLNVSDLSDLIEKYNPFGFKDEDGTICIYETYEEAYIELFERIYKAGPKMVDAVLFVMDNLGMKLPDAERFVALWWTVAGQKECEFFFDWKDGDCLESTLSRFAMGMHLISETKFNRDLFLSALTKFRIKHKMWIDPTQ